MIKIQSIITFCVSCTVMSVMLAFSGGCAMGTTGLNISHAPLEPVVQKRQGTVVVHPFTDKRVDTQYIGNKRNGFGMVLGHVGLNPGVKLDVLMTQYFVEALKEVGYNAVIELPAPGNVKPTINCSAVIDGEIVEFWMDLYMMVWHRVGVDVRATRPGSETVLWQKRIDGAEKRTLWLGVTGEFERVVREAMTKALNRATQEFASEEFYSKAINPTGKIDLSMGTLPDVLHLKDGSIIRGQLLAIQPGKEYRLKRKDGSEQVYPVDAVESIERN